MFIANMVTYLVGINWCLQTQVYKQEITTVFDDHQSSMDPRAEQSRLESWMCGLSLLIFKMGCKMPLCRVFIMIEWVNIWETIRLWMVHHACNIRASSYHVIIIPKYWLNTTVWSPGVVRSRNGWHACSQTICREGLLLGQGPNGLNCLWVTPGSRNLPARLHGTCLLNVPLHHFLSRALPPSKSILRRLL